MISPGLRLILSLWRNQSARFYCLSTKTAAGKWKDHFFEKEDFKDIPDFIEDHEGEDIYYCPHGFSRRARLKDEAKKPNLLWADLDEVDPNKLGKLKPTIAIESSPGRFQAIWVIDEKMTESLNKRLTYQIGADKGGWDVTQVLRLPGTQNFKYKTQPKVRLLWSDGPEYEAKAISRRCADLDGEDEETGLTARDVYQKYSKKMEPKTRVAIMAKSIGHGADRSAIIWKLIKDLVEVGMEEEEVFLVMRGTVWVKDKYDNAGRAPEKALRSQIAKAVREKLSGFGSTGTKEKEFKKKREEPVEDDDEELDFVRLEPSPLSGVKRENVDWLWDRRIAVGSLTVIEGPPGLGKSFVTHMVAGCLIDGARIKSDRPTGFPPKKGKVLMFDMENDAATVVRPRLEDNDFRNLDDISVIRKVIPLDQDESILALRDVIQRYKPTLVVFDTLSYFLGAASENSTSDMSQLLERLATVAKENKVAIVLIRHWRKSFGDGASATDKGAGSVAIGGSARAVLSVSKTGDPDLEEDGWCTVSVAKVNVGKKAKSLLYRIKEGDKEEPIFEWGEVYDCDSDEIVSKLGAKKDARKDKEDKSAKDGAKAEKSSAEELIRSRLSGDKIATGDRMRRAAEKLCISGEVLMETAKRLGVEINRDDDWRLKPNKK